VAMVAMVGLSAAAAVVVVVVVVVVIRAAGEAATRCTMEDGHRVDANGRSDVGLMRSERVRRQSGRIERVRGQCVGPQWWVHGRVHGRVQGLMDVWGWCALFVCESGGSLSCH